ncbi:TDT family transporter [Pseudoalteromonas sp. NZS71_1]|uniref:TDT family transporter n=1 Tax=Pseudoalteromonas sp. NZS71_1 TaxID=2792072 RepID=UPI0018CD922B|nr:TDT family transporter [Pseudoalteromonas sp. NZS71_1]
MFKQFKNKVMGAPTAMAGLALGIVSMGWAWENVFNLNYYGQFLGAVFASVLVLLLAAKFLLHPHLLKADLAHPVAGSVIPTFAMANLVISNSIGQFNPLAGDTMWVLAFVLHLTFLVSFLYQRAKKFNFEDMAPSWFVPPVGIIIADITFSGNPTLAWLAYSALVIGISTYAIMLPIMFYRFLLALKSDYEIQPTLAILAAPASLTLAGYFHIVANPSLVIVGALFILAIIKTLIVYVLFIKLLRRPFTPSYAAFTFPMVIGATALFKMADWMQSINLAIPYVDAVNYLATFELIVATAVVGYVCGRYFCHFKLSKQQVT